MPNHFLTTSGSAIYCEENGSGPAILAVPGLGPVKAERYGEAVLAVLANAS